MFSKKSTFNKRGEEYYLDGLKLNDQGNFGLAYERFLQALLSFQNVQNWERVARCHQCLGNVAFNLQRYSESKESWDNALKTFETQLFNKTAAAEISVEIGNVYVDMEEYDGASLYYKKAISLYEESPIGNELGLAHANYKLGLARYIQQRTEESEKLLVSALPIFQRFGQQSDIANIHRRLGDIYIHQKKDLTTAKQLYRKAFEIYSIAALHREQNEVANVMETIEREEANRELIKKNKKLSKQVRQLSNQAPVDEHNDAQGEQNWEVSSPDASEWSDTDNIPISLRQNVNHFTSSPKPSAPPILKIRNNQTATRPKQTKLHQIFDKVTQKQKLNKKVTERLESPNPGVRVLPTVLSTPPTPRRL